jgi:6-pyruvoyltetrahydropterin/6-carboxytetrahydropterin synthase
MTFLTRRYSFSASHRLHSAELSGEENARVFGKCNNPFGHGHNYSLEVTVGGEIDPRTGLVAPPAALDASVQGAVLSRIDHQDLNADVPEFAGLVPTTENLALQISRWLRGDWMRRAAADGTSRALAAARLVRIRLEETGSNSVEMQFDELQNKD